MIIIGIKGNNNCNALGSSLKHVPTSVHGKIVFYEPVPSAKKVGNCWSSGCFYNLK